MAAVIGRGDTRAAAKQHLAEQLALMATTIDGEPAFARDDDGSMVLALDRPWGIEWYRGTDTTARRNSTGDRRTGGPAADLARVPLLHAAPHERLGGPTGRPALRCSPAIRSSRH